MDLIQLSIFKYHPLHFELSSNSNYLLRHIFLLKYHHHCLYLDIFSFQYLLFQFFALIFHLFYYCFFIICIINEVAIITALMGLEFPHDLLKNDCFVENCFFLLHFILCLFIEFVNIYLIVIISVVFIVIVF